MATMSIRGLDDQALAQLKSQAEQEGSSLNGLVLRLLQAAWPSKVLSRAMPVSAATASKRRPALVVT